jgi:hypothetical protein
VRTTFDIDDDALQAAKEIAAMKGVTIGRVISDLLKQALAPARTTKVRNGVPLLPLRRGVPLTMKRVNALRDDA